MPVDLSAQQLLLYILEFLPIFLVHHLNISVDGTTIFPVIKPHKKIT